jgi:predicted metal-dependent hydrolase
MEMPKYRLLANRRAGRIAQRLLAKMWQFPLIFSELLRFCLHLLKVEEAVENFKKAQRIFSYFSSFQPYHL